MEINVLVIDGQGGRIGAKIIELLRAEGEDISISAVGTNVLATQAMLRAGADNAATGENPVVVASRDAHIIVGPIGICIADSLMGEVTAKMAIAVARAHAKRVLLPVNRCDNIVVGIPDTSIAALTRAGADSVLECIKEARAGK